MFVFVRLTEFLWGFWWDKLPALGAPQIKTTSACRQSRLAPDFISRSDRSGPSRGAKAHLRSSAKIDNNDPADSGRDQQPNGSPKNRPHHATCPLTGEIEQHPET